MRSVRTQEQGKIPQRKIQKELGGWPKLLGAPKLCGGVEGNGSAKKSVTNGTLQNYKSLLKKKKAE